MQLCFGLMLLLGQNFYGVIWDDPVEQGNPNSTYRLIDIKGFPGTDGLTFPPKDAKQRPSTQFLR